MTTKICFFIAFITIALKGVNGQTEYLTILNPSNGSFTKIDSLTGVKWIQPDSKTFDMLNQRFIFCGWDANLISFLYTIDVKTGQIISNPLFPIFDDPNDNIFGLQYSSISNKLYAVHWDNSKNTEFFVSINTVTGTFTIIDSIPGVKEIGGNFGFDRINDRYIFTGREKNSNSRLISIDVKTGHVVTDPFFPSLSDPS
jgi:hypothetical protein